MRGTRRLRGNGRNNRGLCSESRFCLRAARSSSHLRRTSSWGGLTAAQGIFPDVDLSPDGGLEGGVSRRHCKIYEEDGEFFVEDLGSANGTFLDGERLTPYLPHVLGDGDRLQLGRVELEIAIEL